MDWMSGPAGLGVVWMGTVWRRVGPRQLTSYTEEVREREMIRERFFSMLPSDDLSHIELVLKDALQLFIEQWQDGAS